MPVARWLMLCTRSIVDQNTNNVSLIEVIEQLVVRAAESEEVTIPISLDLVFLSERLDANQPEKAQGKITFRGPQPGFESAPITFEVNLEQSNRSTNFVRIPAISVHGSGTYMFEASYFDETADEWGVVASYPFDVVCNPPDEPAD